MKFSDLQLEPSLAAEIEKLGYSECTPIQVAAMPAILEGKDVAGLAQTGTGKTAAFLIPLMDRLLKARLKTDDLSEEEKAKITARAFTDWRAQNFILILVPTRELAEQVYENIQKLGAGSGLRGASVYGGTAYDKQKEAFRNSVEFVVATPGRLIDLFKEHIVDLKQVRAIVFDEADRMFDMGFKDDMKYVLQRVPQERQFLVFSATLNFDVLNTAYQFGADPVEIDVSRDQARAENVKDEIFHCGHDEKPKFLISLLKKHQPRQAIIFSNFKFSVERIARFLSENGIPAMGTSSLLTQPQRNKVLEQFKAENDRNILVATDVAARGLDIKGVDMVINFDLPNDAESYVHRIGRTGRAGAEGRAISLVGDKDVESLSRIEDYLKHKLEVGWIENSELVTDFKEFPREFSSNRGGDRGDRPQRSGGSSGGRRDGPPPRSSTGGGYQRDRNRGSGGSGGGPGAGSGDRPNRPQPSAGARRPEGRPEGRSEGRHQSGEAASGDRGNGRPRQEGRSGPRNNDNRNPNSRPAASRPRPSSGRPQPSRPRARPQPSSAKPAAQKGIVQKVKGFFKNLLGS